MRQVVSFAMILIIANRVGLEKVETKKGILERAQEALNENALIDGNGITMKVSTKKVTMRYVSEANFRLMRH